MSQRLLFEETGVISPADREVLRRAYDDPSFAFVHMGMIGAWGRCPAAAS